MSKVVYLTQNPSNPSQMYALWDTGRIDPIGGALPVFDGPEWYAFVQPPGIAMYVTDWNGPAGYVLTFAGGIYPFGGAPAVGTGEYSYISPGVPFTGGIEGVQAAGPPKYVDFAWNPANNGQGYVLDYYGELFHFGGATAAPRVGPIWNSPQARRLEMQWAPFKRSVIMDAYGGLAFDFPQTFLPSTQVQYYDNTRDWARDIVVTAWGASSSVNPSGYLLTANGSVWEWGPTPPQNAFGGPFVGERGTAAGLALINESDPLTMFQVSNLGLTFTYTASTAPTVLAGGASGTPAAIVTDTTRPQLTWSYSDPQSDSQDAWELLVFTQAVVTANSVGLNPGFWRSLAVVNAAGADSTIRGLLCPVDLANGPYRMYVRAKDTSGIWSAWSNRGWTQTVPVPTTPSNLLATVDGFHVNLVLTVPAVEAGQLILFEASDDAGLTWQPVRGAEAVTAALSTYAVDYDIPLGVPRTYRGRVFYATPRSISLPSILRTVTVERYTFALTSTVNPALGGEVFVYGSMGWDREIVATVYEPLGAQYPIVVTDGLPRSRRRSLTLRTASTVEWARVSAVVESGHTLLLREPFGDTTYCKVVGTISRQQLRGLSPDSGGPALAHTHEVEIPLIEVARPVPIPAEV